MVNITALHIHYRDFAGKSHVKVIKPSNPTDMVFIKADIAYAVKNLKDSGKAEYYYVVMEIDRGGKPAYRTIVPKTVF